MYMCVCMCVCMYVCGAWGGIVVKHCATSRTVPGSITGGVTGDFFRGTPDRTMCPEVDSASESEYQGFCVCTSMYVKSKGHPATGRDGPRGSG